MSDGLRLECAHGAALTDAAVINIACTGEISTASTSASTTTRENSMTTSSGSSVSIAPHQPFLQDIQHTSFHRTPHAPLTVQEEQHDALASLSAKVHSRAGIDETRQHRRQQKKIENVIKFENAKRCDDECGSCAKDISC